MKVGVVVVQNIVFKRARLIAPGEIDGDEFVLTRGRLEKNETLVIVRRCIRGVELLAASWGWDVLKTSEIDEPKPRQSWHQWPIRREYVSTGRF